MCQTSVEHRPILMHCACVLYSHYPQRLQPPQGPGMTRHCPPLVVHIPVGRKETNVPLIKLYFYTVVKALLLTAEAFCTPPGTVVDLIKCIQVHRTPVSIQQVCTANSVVFGLAHVNMLLPG